MSQKEPSPLTQVGHDAWYSALVGALTGGTLNLSAAALKTASPKRLARILAEETARRVEAGEAEPEMANSVSRTETNETRSIEDSAPTEYNNLYTDKTLDSPPKTIIMSNAIKGGLDPDSPRAQLHADRYYEEIRKMTMDVTHIAANTGYSESFVDSVKHYLFLDKHDLGENGNSRFDSSFEIAQSWQRLMEGKNIKPHDLTLLLHEAEEMRLIMGGMTQNKAHIEASKKYDYAKEVREYYGEAGKHQKR